MHHSLFIVHDAGDRFVTYWLLVPHCNSARVAVDVALVTY